MEENKNETQSEQKDETEGNWLAKLPHYHWDKRFFFLSFGWLGVLLFALDLLTKWLVVNYVGMGATTYPSGTNSGSIVINGGVTLIPNFLYVICTSNPGSAYSFGANLPWMRYVFIAISWIASFGIVYYWYTGLKKHDNLVNSILMLCFAGALGNAIDRTFYWPNTVGFSGVVDWIQVYLFPGLENWYPFPTFNLADSCLVVGVAMAIVMLIVREIKERKAQK